MRVILLVIVNVLLFGLHGCTSESRGFSLPEGNVAAGKAVYQDLLCHSCHVIADIEQVASNDENAISVKLGGSVSTIKTYGELVTSVINPSHRVASVYAAEPNVSPMPNYNSVLTVQQLVDLVTFLQSEYTLREFTRTQYPHYYP